MAPGAGGLRGMVYSVPGPLANTATTDEASTPAGSFTSAWMVTTLPTRSPSLGRASVMVGPLLSLTNLRVTTDSVPFLFLARTVSTCSPSSAGM